MSAAAEPAPDSPTAVMAQATRYNDLGRYAEAERIVRRALRAHPEHVNLLSKLSFSLLMQKRYDETLAITDQALALAPDLPVLYYRRGWTKWRMGQRDEAIELARRGLELSPHPELKLYLHQDLGRFYNWESRHPEAFTIAEQGLAAFPGDAELLEVTAEALRRQDRYFEADTYYRASIAADPSVGSSWFGKALNDMSLDRARESLAGFARSMALNPGDDWRAARVRYFMSWPVSGYAAAFRWSLPLAAIAALIGGSEWSWTGIVLLVASFGYAVNWLHRGGRLSWTALARLLPSEKLAIGLPFGLANLGGVATVAAVFSGSALSGWLGLVAGLLLWPTLGYDNALSPNEDHGKSLSRRTLENTKWWFVDDFTGHPRRLLTRSRTRLRRRDVVLSACYRSSLR